MHDIWERNRVAALARFPHLEPVLPPEPPPFTHRIVATPKGAPGLVVVHDGEERKYTSLRDPLAEAERFCENHRLRGHGLVILYGLSLGYVAETCLRRDAAFAGKLLVVEPDPSVLAAAAAARDLVPVLSDPRLEIATLAPPEVLRGTLARLAPHAVLGGVGFWEHAPTVQREPELAAATRRQVQWFLSRHIEEVKSALERGPMLQRNVLRNMNAYLAAGRPHDRAGAWAGRPALLVAAGPSLSKNLGALRDMPDRALILVVDTALRLLLEEDILPDAVLAVDPTELNFRHFEDLIDDPRLAEIPLLFDLESTPQLVERYPGPKWGMPLDKSRTTRFLAECRGEPEAWTKGASVVLAGFSFARYLGAEPIIFAGLDLAYDARTGQTHASGAALSQAVDESQFHWVDGVDGQPVPTSSTLEMYLRRLEEEIEATGARCIDATEGGARIRGTELATLAETLSHLPRRDPALRPLACPEPAPGARGKALNRLAEDLIELRHLAETPADGWSVAGMQAAAGLQLWLQDALFPARFRWMSARRNHADDAVAMAGADRDYCAAAKAVLAEFLPLLEEVVNS